MRAAWLSLLLLLTRVALTVAQQLPTPVSNATAPMPVYDAAYAKYKNKLYIYGGVTRVDGGLPENSMTGQFFALDLSTSWHSDSPAWIPLPEGPQSYGSSAAISLDGKIMVPFPTATNTIYRYDFDKSTWAVSLFPWGDGNRYLSPVTVPTNGQVLMLGGITTNGRDHYEWYSFADDKISGRVDMPPPGRNNTNYLPSRHGYKAAWSKRLNNVVVYGGDPLDYFTKNATQWVSLFDPVTNQWKTMNTRGTNNHTSYLHCVATNDEGTRLFSYGGNVGSEAAERFRSKLFILDLLKGTWTNGADSRDPRSDTTCTVAGDYFLVWGGRAPFQKDVDAVVDMGKSSSPVMIYQISMNKWVQEYRPPPDYVETSISRPTSPTSDDNPSGNRLNIGAIVGGAVGALVVILLVAFLIWKRRKRRRQGKGKQIQNEGRSGSEIELSDPQRLEGENNGSFIFQKTSHEHQHPHLKGYGEEDVEIKGRYW